MIPLALWVTFSQSSTLIPEVHESGDPGRPRAKANSRGGHFQHRLLSLPLELLIQKEQSAAQVFDPTFPTLHPKQCCAVMVGPLAAMLFMTPNSPGNCHVTLPACPHLLRRGKRDHRGGAGRKGSEFKRRGFVGIL